MLFINNSLQASSDSCMALFRLQLAARTQDFPPGISTILTGFFTEPEQRVLELESEERAVMCPGRPTEGVESKKGRRGVQKETERGLTYSYTWQEQPCVEYGEGYSTSVSPQLKISSFKP
ncbi:hypothetical protein F2P79_003477 [Pimephales promelas]|nr:hypothetical protein F2P79_003477 [Pimephales promelas]